MKASKYESGPGKATQFWLPPHVRAKIDAQAKARGISKSELIVKLVERLSEASK